MVISISLNGPDNVGKTTQLQLLPAHFMISKVGSLHDNDEMIAELHRRDRLKEWWWDSTPAESVTTIFGALARRRRNATAGENRDVVVFDRGISMFETVAVAVITMKDENGIWPMPERFWTESWTNMAFAFHRRTWHFS